MTSVVNLGISLMNSSKGFFLADAQIVLTMNYGVSATCSMPYEEFWNGGIRDGRD